MSQLETLNALQFAGLAMLFGVALFWTVLFGTWLDLRISFHYFVKSVTRKE